MEELRPPLTESKRRKKETSKKRKKQTPVLHPIKKVCLSAAASIGEGFGYVKAAAVGLAKKLTAKSEEEATYADLQVAKMQVDATNHAEDIKKRLN